MSSFSAYSSGKKKSGSSKKSSTSPAPLGKLKKVRKGTSSLTKIGPTTFKLNRGKRPPSSLLKIGPNTRTSSSPSTDIVRETTPDGKTRITISPKPHGRSIFSPTDNEVNNINNSRILSNHSVAHNSDLSKKSPPIIQKRRNSLEDPNSSSFRKTPVDEKHLKKPARHFDDDGHLTPLSHYPMDSPRPEEKDLFGQEAGRNMFDFSPYDNKFPIHSELKTSSMDVYLEHLVSEIERIERERNKVRQEEIRLEKRLDRLNKMVRDNLKRKKSKGTKKGNGAGSSSDCSSNKLHEIINQLKF